MTLSIPLLLLGIFICTNATAEVYKRTNPDGSVTFSDVPTKIDAEPITLPPSSTYSAPPQPRAAAKTQPKKAEMDYVSVSITSPANDTTIRDSAGNITITISVDPALKSEHSTVLIMDGKNVGEGHAGSIQLTNLDRGSHTFIAQVVDNQKIKILESDPVTVHLQRTSTINRNIKKR